MPVTKRSEAKESGWAQVRAALTKFEGDVLSADFDTYPPSVGEDGKPLPPKEFLEVVCANVKVLEFTEPLSMDINGQEYTFRVNCSDYTGSFWIEDFLEAADRFKLLIPDDIVGKRLLWKRLSREFDIKGVKRYAVGFVVDGVIGSAATSDSGGVAPAAVLDPMVVSLELAVGKTEEQFRSSISLSPGLDDAFKTLAKTGAITNYLVTENKLVIVTEGDRQVYRKPG